MLIAMMTKYCDSGVDAHDDDDDDDNTGDDRDDDSNDDDDDDGDDDDPPPATLTHFRTPLTRFVAPEALGSSIEGPSGAARMRPCHWLRQPA
eukprot:570719-Pyramimonas_sp.AAC.1